MKINKENLQGWMIRWNASHWNKKKTLPDNTNTTTNASTNIDNNENPSHNLC